MTFSQCQSEEPAARSQTPQSDKQTFMGRHAEFGTDIGMQVGRAMLFDDGQSSGVAIRTLISGMGYTISDATGQVNALRQTVEAIRPDLIVIRAASTSSVLLEELRALPAECCCPVVMFSEDGSPTSINAAVEAGVNSYVVIGATGNRVRSAVELAYANFHAARGLRAERDEALAALRDRKIIERAKGLVMKERGLDEAGAYALLRKRAMQKGIRLVDVATMINEAAEMMRD
jgi:two-component system, response regulator / RNA-binding antiterminator